MLRNFARITSQRHLLFRTPAVKSVSPFTTTFSFFSTSSSDPSSQPVIGAFEQTFFANNPTQQKGEVLYKADRGRLFKAASAFGVFNLGWWVSLAGFDVTAFFNDGSIGSVDGSLGFQVAPELTAVGMVCSVAILGLVKFYSSKNVGLVVLHPSATKVMIATHDMFGRLIPRECSVNNFTQSPHANSQYHLFKIDDDSWYTMIDREVGEFLNEAKLVRMLEGRIYGQIAMPTPTRPVRGVVEKSEELKDNDNDGVDGDGYDENAIPILSARAAQNRQRKNRKNNKNIRR
jgi:hypothetical protein